MKMKIINTIAFLLLLVTLASAQGKQRYNVRMGDKYYNVFNYTNAIVMYKKALEEKKVDSVYVLQKLANSYRLFNNPKEAEYWYGVLVAKSEDPKNFLYYADALRQNLHYADALIYYKKYNQIFATDNNIKSTIEGINNLPKLAKEIDNYDVQLMGINTEYSDFGAAFYRGDTILYSSNKIGKNDFSKDNWSTNNFYKIYKTSPLSAKAPAKAIKIRNAFNYHDGPVTYDSIHQELIFTRTNYKSKLRAATDKVTVNLSLYTISYPTSSNKEKPKIMPFCSREFSCAHPSISRDGNTLYFTSNLPGGLGGTDIYKVERTDAGWSAPINLGQQINSSYDEKFPFIGDDQTLFFASNALGGLGGLDIYYAKPSAESIWNKPYNLGSPINSNKDDFGLISNQSSLFGYFSSNRDGGIGDDDIYSFTWKESPKKSRVLVQVIDGETKLPLQDALVSGSCVPNSGTMITNDTGKLSFMADLNLYNCVLEASAVGYRKNTATVAIENTAGTIIIPLFKNVIKVKVLVKEQKTNYPIRDVNIMLKDMSNNYIITVRTNADGYILEPVNNVAGYKIGSNDFISDIVGYIGVDEKPDADGYYVREYYIPYKTRKVNVPISSDCFANKVPVIVIDNNTKEEVLANVDQFGLLTVALRPYCSYTFKFNGKTEILNTKSLYPGQIIQLECKYVVGQTWLLRNIYYDLDKAYIRPDAAIEFDKLVYILQQNPTLEIELSSHTDCRSSAAYNQALSTKRAKAAVAYIVSKGISAKRIKAVGYGESKLVNDCSCEPSDDSSCTEEQHQANRRTEVKVTKY